MFLLKRCIKCVWGGGGVLLQKDKKIINSRSVYTAPLHIPRLYFTSMECNDYNEYRLKEINVALHELKY